MWSATWVKVRLNHSASCVGDGSGAAVDRRGVGVSHVRLSVREGYAGAGRAGGRVADSGRVIQPPVAPRRRARVVRGRWLRPALVGVVTVLPLLLAGCGDEPRPDAAGVAETAPSRRVPAYGTDDTLPAGQAALSLVPADATVVTVTDFDASRRALGVPELTSEDPVGDRTDYWERAPRESVLLAAGMLHEHDSVLVLDHGFTSDDVDWEAHFLTPDGPGWALGLRPDLDMAPGRRTRSTPGWPGLRGADVDAARHLVSSGAAAGARRRGPQRPGIVRR